VRGFAVRPVLWPPPELGAGEADDPPREPLPLLAEGQSPREPRGTLPRAFPSLPD
jgi:hypothetical protein